MLNSAPQRTRGRCSRLPLLLSLFLGLLLFVSLTACSKRAVPALDYKIFTNTDDHGDEVILLAPSGLGDRPSPKNSPMDLVTSSQKHLEIRAKNGQVLKTHQLPLGDEGANFQVQYFHNKPVFTWWQGHNEFSRGNGEYVISDLNFNILKTFKIPEINNDLHVFLIINGNTALVSSLNPIPEKINIEGTPTQTNVLNAIFTAYNLDTNTPIFQWKSLDHIPVTDSMLKPHAGKPYDYFHINSVTLDPQGNYLLSSRNTSALYDIDSHTGKIIWTMGGKHSSFAIAPQANFSFQHDAEFLDPHTLQIFDNHVTKKRGEFPSTILRVNVDFANKKVIPSARFGFPGKGVFSFAMGNAQNLPNGKLMCSWGTAGYVVEFNSKGKIIYSARLSRYYTTYRAFLYPKSFILGT